MSTPTQFESDQLDRTAQELSHVRETFKAQTKRLNEAEQALLFYANPKNYEVTRKLDGRSVFQDRLKGDYSLADNDQNTNIAGRRAREYFKLYERK